MVLGGFWFTCLSRTGGSWYASKLWRPGQMRVVWRQARMKLNNRRDFRLVPRPLDAKARGYTGRRLPLRPCERPASPSC